MGRVTGEFGRDACASTHRRMDETTAYRQCRAIKTYGGRGRAAPASGT